MGSFTLLSVNIDAAIVKMEQENEIVCFVDEDLSLEDARAIEPAIRSVGNINTLEFITREEAMEDFSQDYDPGLFEDVDASVFRHRYVLTLSDITLIAQTQSALQSVDGVAKVRAHLDIANTFISIRNVMSVVSLIIVAILAW
jgi:cell division transport system permease protein